MGQLSQLADIETSLPPLFPLTPLFPLPPLFPQHQWLVVDVWTLVSMDTCWGGNKRPSKEHDERHISFKAHLGILPSH